MFFASGHKKDIFRYYFANISSKNRIWKKERYKPNNDSSAPLINNLSFDSEERFESAKKLVSFKTLPEGIVTSYKKVHRIRSKVSFFLTEKIVGHSYIQIRNSCFFLRSGKKKTSFFIFYRKSSRPFIRNFDEFLFF